MNCNPKFTSKINLWAIKILSCPAILQLNVFKINEESLTVMFLQAELFTVK